MPEPECPPPACGQWSERYVESPACSWKIMSMEVAICSWRMCSVRGGGRAGGRSIVVGFWVCAHLGGGDWGRRCTAQVGDAVQVRRRIGAEVLDRAFLLLRLWRFSHSRTLCMICCCLVHGVGRLCWHTSLRIEMVAFIASRPCTFFFIMETKFQCTIPTQPHLCNNRLEIWVRSKLAKKVYIYTTCVFSGFRLTLIKWVVPCRTVCLS